MEDLDGQRGAAEALINPPAAGPAVPVGYFHEKGIDEVPRRLLDWSACTPLLNTSGLPAVSLPAHAPRTACPAASGWPHRHPSQWSL